MTDRSDFYPRIPFYMAYPAQSMYLTEMEYEKDLERMKSYYTAEAQKVMKLVEQRLDELEYEGSRIYDEEPDRLMIQMEVDRLYRMLAEEEETGKESRSTYFEMVPLSLSERRPCRDSWLCSMVGVLFNTELYKRRCRHRRCRRYW